MTIDKSALLVQVRARVADDLAALTDSQRETQAGATHEEARPENDKDTRAIEASYLARGLAERVSALREASVRLAGLVLRRFAEDDAIALSTLVTVEEQDGATLRYFVLPAGAGIKLRTAGGVVRVVTPEAPVGRLLLGKHVGDELALPGPGGGRSVEIVAVA